MAYLKSILVLAILFSINLAQDKSKFVEPKKGFYSHIVEEIDKFEDQKEKKKSFQVDLDGVEIPTSLDEFTLFWHQDPISQGSTGNCWSYSTTSFFESEVYRLHGKEVDVSEIFTVYWEYVEKAKGFVQSRGEWIFPTGSEANAVTRVWEKYGCVPNAEYIGLEEGQKFHNHSHLYREMKTYLDNVKENNAWNEEEILTTIRSILDYHLGTPPEKFVVDGKEYTPKTYLSDHLKMNMDDYVDILSYMQQPYWEQVEYEVPDNWWHNKDYWNVPLDDFMKIFKNAVHNGYSVCIGGDVSEPGKVAEKDVFMIPSFDIPSEYITDEARQFRFSNKTTTDDHGVHVVGWTNLNGTEWYLIKDSGSSARDGNHKGYYFFHEDYIKLKIMDFMIHKDALGDYSDRLK